MISLDIEFKKSEVSDDNIAIFKSDALDYVLHKTINELLKEFHIDYKEEWHSKYNKYVVYEYEPSCKDGLCKVYKVKSNNHIMFIVSILKDYISAVNNLDRLLELEFKVNE